MRKLWLIGGATAVIAAGAAFVLLSGAKSPAASADAKDKKPDVTLEFTSREVVNPKSVTLPRRIEFTAPHDAPRTAIRDYWLSLADAAEREGNAEGCYQYLYHAGWDMGLPALDEYGPLLERMAAVAEGMGSSALAKLARAHLRSLL